MAVQADTDFQFYKSGILNNPDCGQDLNHAIVAVGYDLAQGFYIVRNSWGPWWGENGYVRLAITSGAGICGVQMDPSWSVTN